MKYLKAHFQKYRTRQPFDFLWRITLEGLLVSIAVACIFLLAGADGRESMESMRFQTLILAGLIAAPIFETLALQIIPIEVLRSLNAKFSLQIIVSMVVFFLPHLYGGIATGFAAGLVGGFYFAFTYAHWRQKSWWTATWVTAASHAIHNLVAITMVILFEPDTLTW